jgi:hypothetical protein
LSKKNTLNVVVHEDGTSNQERSTQFMMGIPTNTSPKVTERKAPSSMNYDI